MGKTRDLLKKIRDTKGTFHAKMGTKKDTNNMDWEGIKKRWQEHMEELYKKKIIQTIQKRSYKLYKKDPDNHYVVITHLEPDILECKIKWALVRKHHYKQTSGGDGIPVELFQILKDAAMKVLHSICQ